MTYQGKHPRAINRSAFWQCDRKIEYSCKREADRVAKALGRKRGVSLRAYKCRYGNHWHLAKRKQS